MIQKTNIRWRNYRKIKQKPPENVHKLQKHRLFR